MSPTASRNRRAAPPNCRVSPPRGRAGPHFSVLAVHVRPRRGTAPNNTGRASVPTQLSAVDAIHVVEHEVADSQDSRFGTRYTVEGELTTPQGRRPLVRVVWFVDKAASLPRFVTAYPLGRSTQ